MFEALEDNRIHRVLTAAGDDRPWRADFERLIVEDTTLTRKSAGEESIQSLQRLMIFLGYSTASSGAFLIDGDFGRGTNRGVAQFQVEHGIATAAGRADLCYDCTFQTARSRIGSVPDIRLDVQTLDAMLKAAVKAIDTEDIAFGNLEDALFHLNALHRRSFLICREIRDRYQAAADAAVAAIREERGITIQPHWVLSIIRQETAGIARPRFEQHKLSSANKRFPDEDLAELRLQSMSIGLGQIMGFNHKLVGAAKATEMYTRPAGEQVLYVARFLSRGRSIRDALQRSNPRQEDYRAVARFYNGPAYAAHHYHERLERWFREFMMLDE